MRTVVESRQLGGGFAPGRTGGCTGPSFIERTSRRGRGEGVKIRRGEAKGKKRKPKKKKEGAVTGA